MATGGFGAPCTKNNCILLLITLDTFGIQMCMVYKIISIGLSLVDYYTLVLL